MASAHAHHSGALLSGWAVILGRSTSVWGDQRTELAGRIASMSAGPVSTIAGSVTPVVDAVASSRLEGLEPSEEFLADAIAVDDHRLDADELVERALARHRH